MKIKTLLVRVNLDIKEEKVSETLRFKIAADLIKDLSKDDNKVVILSHRGRPERYDKKLSLKPFAALLSEDTGKKIVFLSNLRTAKKEIENAPGGIVFMLENLRFVKWEAQNSILFARRLAALGDEYINNDFGTSHRKESSLVAITKLMPSRKGELLKGEIKALSGIVKKSRHPFVLIVGGAKVKSKASVIRRLLPHADAVLLGGGVANTFLKAKGVDIKKSLYEPNMIQKIGGLCKNKKIITPTDWVIENGRILDIGSKTVREYSKLISEAKTIIWAGPMGMFEKKKFAKGNDAIAKAVLKNKKARIVIGGAETVYSLPIKIDSQQKENVFFSTGGGSMLHFLVGKKLPAIAALERAKIKTQKSKV